MWACVILPVVYFLGPDLINDDKSKLSNWQIGAYTVSGWYNAVPV